jgi:simple sugar transport system permease protein
MTTEVQLEAEATQGVAAARRRFAARRWREHLGLTLALLALFCFLTLTAPNFLTATNITNVMHQVAYVGIIAWAMTLVILAGEIDISVGSAAAFAGVMLALLLEARIPAALAVLGTLLTGTAIGLLAGAIRATFIIPSFIVTLALYEALRGLALLLTNAIPQAPETLHNHAFTFLGSGDLGGIPIAALILMVLFAAFWFASTKTTFGKSVYAIGGNAEAARLAGIRVSRIRTVLFGLTGLMAAVSGVLLAASLGAGDPETSVGLEFDAIAAVIVGGTNLFGGSGSLVGTAIGVVFIGILGNGLVLLGVNPYATTVVRGAVILVAVLLTSPGLRARLQDLGRELRRLTGGEKSE